MCIHLVSNQVREQVSVILLIAESNEIELHKHQAYRVKTAFAAGLCKRRVSMQKSATQVPMSVSTCNTMVFDEHF